MSDTTEKKPRLKKPLEQRYLELINDLQGLGKSFFFDSNPNAKKICDSIADAIGVLREGVPLLAGPKVDDRQLALPHDAAVHVDAPTVVTVTGPAHPSKKNQVK